MSRTSDPATRYARAVVAGKVVAGRLVRLACERHLRDLETAAARGLVWDAKAAKHALDFFDFLRLPGDESRPFKLQPFQEFVVGSLFGWKGADGHRRFRTAYCEIGKGSGKSPLAAALGLYMLAADGEPGAEVYAAAVTREQAGIAFRDARNMAEASPALRGRLDVGLHNIAYPAAASFFRPVSSEHRGLDGKRVHFAIIDEIHEHPTSLVADKMRAGTKARTQALILEITNSGYDRQSVCWHHHEYSRKVLEGSVEDDAWFAYVCTLDPCARHEAEGKSQPADDCPDCDDWRNEAVWLKANPGLGTILPAKYLREQVHEAKGMPSKEGIVRRLNFCQWTESVTSWLPAALWARGARPVDAAALKGRRCWGGLDLASRSDVTALVLCFEGDEPEPVYSLLPFFWIPEERAREREHKDRVPYVQWQRKGLVEFTSGNVTDYNAVKAKARQLLEDYFVEEVAYDPWNATQTAVDLGDYGLKMIEFGQSLRNFNEPTKEFEALLRAGRIAHGSHPVLDWMAANASVKTDPSGNVRPVKPEHHEASKVDGIVAAVMALARALLARASVYDARGLEVVGAEEVPAAAAPAAVAEAPARTAWADMWRDDPDD